MVACSLGQLTRRLRVPLAYSDPSEWNDVHSPLSLCDLPELRPVSCAACVDEIEVERFNRFSSYDRMLRVVAYMRRFIAAVEYVHNRTTSRSQIFAKVGTRLRRSHIRG